MATWLAKRRETLVVSLESFSIALIICSMGVMPGGGEGKEEGWKGEGREGKEEGRRE